MNDDERISMDFAPNVTKRLKDCVTCGECRHRIDGACYKPGGMMEGHTVRENWKCTQGERL